MPVPKRKTSQSKRDSRRSQQKLEVATGSVCPQCKSPKLPHRACAEVRYLQRPRGHRPRR